MFVGVCVCVCVCLRRKGEDLDRIMGSFQISMLITRSLWKLVGFCSITTVHTENEDEEHPAGRSWHGSNRLTEVWETPDSRLALLSKHKATCG